MERPPAAGPMVEDSPARLDPVQFAAVKLALEQASIPAAVVTAMEPLLAPLPGGEPHVCNEDAEAPTPQDMVLKLDRLEKSHAAVLATKATLAEKKRLLDAEMASNDKAEAKLVELLADHRRRIAAMGTLDEAPASQVPPAGPGRSPATDKFAEAVGTHLEFFARHMEDSDAMNRGYAAYVERFAVEHLEGEPAPIHDWFREEVVGWVRKSSQAMHFRLDVPSSAGGDGESRGSQDEEAAADGKSAASKSPTPKRPRFQYAPYER